MRTLVENTDQVRNTDQCGKPARCRSPFFALEFLLCSVLFWQFFQYSRGLESSGIRCSAGHNIGLRFKPVLDFLRGECWVFDNNLRNGLFRISRKNAWSITSFLFSSPFSRTTFILRYIVDNGNTVFACKVLTSFVSLL